LGGEVVAACGRTLASAQAFGAGTAYDDVERVVRAMRSGAFDYITKPFDFNHINLSIERALAASQIKREIRRLRREQKYKRGFDHIIAKSEEMERVLHIVLKIGQRMHPPS
jgi:DNA-binding NtrC family response regulator